MDGNQLIDRFGRAHSYLRISVTDKCNLRCLYCMPDEHVPWYPLNVLLTNDEIAQLAKLFISLGVNKIRITGGEPLVRPNINSLLERLAYLKKTGLKTFALTTNGTMLQTKLGFLKEIGLDALNISLDTLHRDRFFKITQRDAHEKVWSSVCAAIDYNFSQLKLNVVVIKGFNDDEILDFAQLAYDNKINVRFIEFMPFKNNNWYADEVVPFSSIKAVVEGKYKLLPIATPKSSVAKDFAIQNGKGGISFITSMTDSFCSSCNRLRITADGFIKSCLFSTAEINVRLPLRQDASDKELAAMVLKSLALKPEAHPPAGEIAADLNRPMIAIGG